MAPGPQNQKFLLNYFLYIYFLEKKYVVDLKKMGSDVQCDEDLCQNGDKPTCLIVRDFPNDVFVDDEIKQQFEQLFSVYGTAFFTYLPGFQRIIVKYTDKESAVTAQSQLNGVSLDDRKVLRIFFKEDAKKFGDDFLTLPKAQRLFLISPPASPPVGWEPIEEPIPVVNYDLVSAVARLEIPGKPVELVSKTDMTPGIIVIGCDDPVDTNSNLISMRNLPREQLQTQRPPITSS